MDTLLLKSAWFNNFLKTVKWDTSFITNTFKCVPKYIFTCESNQKAVAFAFALHCYFD